MPEDNEATQTRKAKLYGRKWKILIYKPAYTEKTETRTDGTSVTVKERDPDHDTAVDVSNLRCVFNVKHQMNTYLTQCSLIVYNLNAVTEGSILTEGFQVSIEAGYQEGQYGEIFSGDIIQCFRNRENGIDYRLEIVAIKGRVALSQNFVKISIAAGSTPRTQLSAIVQDAKEPLELGTVSENLKQEPLPRGKVLFGTPAKYLRGIAVPNDAHFWVDTDDTITIQKVVDEIPDDMCLELTPETGLIGTPVYTDNGIQISMLLDARVKERTLIKIDNEIIKRQAINLSQSQQMMNSKSLDTKGSGPVPQQYQFDRNGEYQVFSVSHSGDTWGDTWKTEVVGVSRQGRTGLPVPMDNSMQTTR